MPAAEVNDLVDALNVIESDHYGCFFGLMVVHQTSCNEADGGSH